MKIKVVDSVDKVIKSQKTINKLNLPFDILPDMFKEYAEYKKVKEREKTRRKEMEYDYKKQRESLKVFKEIWLKQLQQRQEQGKKILDMVDFVIKNTNDPEVIKQALNLLNNFMLMDSLKGKGDKLECFYPEENRGNGGDKE